MAKKPSERLKAIRDFNARKKKIQEITDALVASGYTSLDDQAKALGLHRATVWTIRKNQHKKGRLCTKTIERIMTNATTPPRVRAAVKEYISETSD
jgi:LPS O-antigen subunit length determinant protein (WzzB/FepE family)